MKYESMNIKSPLIYVLRTVQLSDGKVGNVSNPS